MMATKKHNPGFIALVEQSKSRIQEMDVDEAALRLHKDVSIVFIDVREDHEFAIDSCAGAIHIGKGVIERDIEKRVPDKDQEMIVYCGGGYRSALVADALQTMGYRRVVSMIGGIRAWRTKQLAMNPPA
jgi:rhodanese-related sulfurtransferase